MKRTTWRAWTVAVIAAGGLLAVAGCEAKSSYKPPTASVNGGRPAIDPAPAGAADPTATDARAGATAAAPTGTAADDTSANNASTRNERRAAASEPGGYKQLPAGEHSASAPPREEYFVGWARPKLALVISGRQDGYLEPCGCAGLENQKGGLNRRHALFKELAQKGWPLAAVDVGGQVRRFGTQAEVQFTLVADALKQLGYCAIGFGPSDLRLPAGHIVSAVAGADPADTVFVSANVSLFDLTPKVRVIEAGGMTLGITSVLV
jgi:hypothetical protein